MKIIFSKKCLEYGLPGHPESPERIRKSYEFLKGRFVFLEPEPCDEKDILRAHSKELLQAVKSSDFSDPDTPNYPNIFELAKLSAGAAIKAAEVAIEGESSFSLMRPPGHHAGRDFLGGFCYLNNMAIGIKKSLESLEKVVILDIDCHHGNGSQDIFLGDKRVLYISLHQSPLYPGTGKVSEKNCINNPLPLGTNGNQYLEVLKNAAEKIKIFKPDAVGVSAGFDTYKDDPIANMNLDLETYRKIGVIIKDLNIPTFSILEGGYSRDLPLCIYEFLNGLSK